MIVTILEWLLANVIEMLAFIFGLAGVWLTARQNVWCWPTGLVNIILSFIVFFTSKLYADVVLQIFYLVMTIYGWYNWLYGGENKTVLKIRRIKLFEIIIIFVAGSAGVFLVGWIFSTYTNAALPYIDSLVAVWGVIGTWAMARKIIEHWVIWIFTDMICTGIYAYKELYFFAVLYFIFVILAIYGLVKWRKELIRSQLSAA
jgi:nicotinamide mononucleotide transporter